MGVDTDGTGAGATQERGRRGCGRLLKGGCGCLAFGLGALVVLLLLAPTLLGGWVARLLEDGFEESFHGSLELADLGLSWTGRQSLGSARLRDPEGRVVVEGSARLPSIRDLVTAAARQDERGELDLGLIEVELEGDLVADEERRTNVERALAPRDGVEVRATVEGGAEARGELVRLFESLRLELALRSRRLTWTDPLRSVGAHDVAGHLRFTPRRPAELALEGLLEAAPGSRARFTLAATASGLRETGAGLDLDALDARVTVEGVPPELIALLDPRAAPAPELAAFLARPIALGLSLERGAEVARDLRASLRSDAIELDLVAKLAGGRLVASKGGGGPASSGRLSLPRALLAELQEGLLPQDCAVAGGEDGLELGLTLTELSLPLLAESPARDATVIGAVRVGALRYEDARLAAAGGAVAVERAELVVRARPQGPLVIEVDSTVAGGSVTARMRLDPAWPGLLEGAALDTVPIALDVEAEDLPTAPLDAFLARGGLLVETLGPRLGLVLTGRRLGTGGGRIGASMSSALGRVEWEGRLVAGELRSAGSGRLDAELVALGPLLSARIVGPLVPLLVELEKPAGATPLKIGVRDFVLPLDGDLSKLDATVSLELGEVGWLPLPGLGQLVSAAAGRGPRRSTFGALSVRIEGGKASYEALPFELGGRRCDLAGSFDLKTRRFDLRTAVPLASLGGEVGAQLAQVRSLVPADTTVPLRLAGTWNKPRVKLEPGFVQGLLRQAAESALKDELKDELQKGLRKLLGDDDG